MATTREYTDYLNDQVDIAPANSQEEYQAAELIEDLFVQHGLETQIQEFDAPTASGMSSRLYLITLFLGVLLAGFIGTPVSIVGLVLVVISFILLALAKNGTDLFASAGPRARSQNVIGVHRATGPNVIKGNRPIVIIAHYDTPRENYLYSAQLAKWNPLIKRLSWPLSIAVAVLACMQVIPFVPLPARHVFWVLGVLAALPLLLLGSAAVYERFANCTTGANDNKASVAAMLGVLDMVRPGPDDAKAWAETHPRGVRHEVEDEVVIEDDPYNPEAWDEDELDEEGLDEEFDDESQEPAGEQSYEDEDYEEEYAVEEEYAAAEEKPSLAARIPFFGRRHEAEEPEPEPEQDEYGLQSPSTIRRGASVLESLQVLPETCVIEYENLAPRAEVIERIESAAFAAPSDGGAYEPEPGEGFGDYGSARGGISGFLASIREFFAGIVARFKGGKFPQIERGETQQFYNSDEDDQYEEAEGSADFDAT
ncbi:MAG: hypothetical protein J6D34_07395, partial [Atopobiaceae bacterium]|nr:hypothetical protein [Atopobiaceae bacterium]